MKSKSMLVMSALFISATSSNAANFVTTYNITGATAFRAAANLAIIDYLGGTGNVPHAYTGSSLNATNRAIFKRTIVDSPNVGDNTITIIRASWSGSTQGILDLADQTTTVQFLKPSVTMTTAGTVNPGAAGDFENGTARFAFSDVDKLLSARPNSAIQGEGVGVVPFMFVTGESAPAAVSNMTDQLHATLWSTGSLPASMFTGNPANANFTILATGRNNGSGTRASVLSETQYGAFTNVVQFNQTNDGTGVGGSLTGAPTLYAPAGNGGGTSNSFVKDLLVRSSSPSAFGGRYAFVSYLTISDAVTATGYDQASGLITLPSEGAKPMTYNGVRYSEANVNNGSYTLWSFQQFYRAADSTVDEDTFATDLKTNIDNVLIPSIGLKTSGLAVERTGGDGGPVAPL
jgi:hypothetical protein